MSLLRDPKVLPTGRMNSLPPSGWTPPPPPPHAEEEEERQEASSHALTPTSHPEWLVTFSSERTDPETQAAAGDSPNQNANADWPPSSSRIPSSPSLTHTQVVRVQVTAWVRTIALVLVSCLLGMVLCTTVFLDVLLPRIDWGTMQVAAGGTPATETTDPHIQGTKTTMGGGGGTQHATTPTTGKPSPTTTMVAHVSRMPTPTPTPPTREWLCSLGRTVVEDHTGKAELDTTAVRAALSREHLAMTVLVEEQAPLGVTSQEQLGSVMQASLGQETLTANGTVPTVPESCSLYLVIVSSQDWVAIGQSASIHPFTAAQLQQAQALYTRVEHQTGRHTQGVLSVLAALHGILATPITQGNGSTPSSPPTPTVPRP